MNDRVDSCGQRNERAGSNILPGGGARLDRGDATWREAGASAVHCGRASVGANVGGAIGTNAVSENLARSSPGAGGECSGSGAGEAGATADLSRIPAEVRATVASRPGEYDARRLRSQREIIRDVMLSAADCETWLTLGELRALTRYGEASISAQLRHLRKSENGGYEVVKRHREGVSPERPGADGRGECVWEYRITRGSCGELVDVEARLEAVGA
ncbi:MAG: hypothetical protein WCA19_00870 [Candidatus Acidiferrales bacterium]